MSIENLQSLIDAKEKQMGVHIREEDKEEPSQSEIMKLLFQYVKESMDELRTEIAKIQQKQQKILDVVRKEED
jgi:hypothetical protein